MVLYLVSLGSMGAHLCFLFFFLFFLSKRNVAVRLNVDFTAIELYKGHSENAVIRIEEKHRGVKQKRNGIF